MCVCVRLVWFHLITLRSHSDVSDQSGGEGAWTVPEVLGEMSESLRLCLFL